MVTQLKKPHNILRYLWKFIYYDPKQIKKQAIYFRKKKLLRNVLRNHKAHRSLQCILLCKLKGNIFQSILSDSDTYHLILEYFIKGKSFLELCRHN